MLRKLMILIGCMAAMAMFVAACNGDDDDDIADDETAVTDVTPETTPDDATPDATPDDATPDATPEDTTPEATPEEPMEQTVQVILTEYEIEIQDGAMADDGVTDDDDNGTPMADATPEGTPENGVTDDDDETPTADATPENGVTDDMTGVTLSAGTTIFNVENQGDEEHSLAIEPADENGMMDDDETPTADATPEDTPATNGMMAQEWDETLESGDTGTWEVDLEPGTYILYCPIGDHRDQGMEIEITVMEAGDDNGMPTPEATPENGVTDDDDETPTTDDDEDDDETPTS